MVDIYTFVYIENKIGLSEWFGFWKFIQCEPRICKIKVSQWLKLQQTMVHAQASTDVDMRHNTTLSDGHFNAQISL